VAISIPYFKHMAKKKVSDFFWKVFGNRFPLTGSRRQTQPKLAVRKVNSLDCTTAADPRAVTVLRCFRRSQTKCSECVSTVDGVITAEKFLMLLFCGGFRKIILARKVAEICPTCQNVVPADGPGGYG
jgi:hypothetical protein